MLKYIEISWRKFSDFFTVKFFTISLRIADLQIDADIIFNI